MSISELEKVSANNYCHSMKDQFREHIYDRSEVAFKAGDLARDSITTVKSLHDRQKNVRNSFLAGMGGLPSLGTPLNARVTGIIREKGLQIEKVIFESRPNTFVTANFYLPDNVTLPCGAVLFLCGHAEQAKHYPEYQMVCHHLVQAGLIVLAVDPIGQGERFSYYESTLSRSTVSWGVTEHDYAGAQCLVLGDGIARYFLHDAIRGLDYLCSRPEVDSTHIGVTGNSGGGTQTAMMMLADQRISAAAPGTFIMNRRTYQQAGGAQDAEQIWKGFSSEGFDHEDILLAMCPKPVCVLAVTSDFFPIEGTRETVERCRRLWQMAGNTTDLELIEDCSTHAYTPFLARAAAKFFSRHLLGRDMAVDSTTVHPISPEKLLCTRSGQVRGEIDGARAVWDENQDRLKMIKAQQSGIPDVERRKRAVDWLRNKVLSNRIVTPLNIRIYPQVESEDEMICDLGDWWSQKGIFNEGLLFRNALIHKPSFPVTLALWNGGTKTLQEHVTWLRKTCESGRAVLVLNLSGMGPLEPNTLDCRSIHGEYGVIHKLNDDLLWLGDSICALRIWDVLRTLDAIDAWPGLDTSDITVYTRGVLGLYAELAAVLEPRLARIEVVEGMDSFAEFVRARHYVTYDSRAWILPEVLQYADLPDFRRWR